MATQTVLQNDFRRAWEVIGPAARSAFERVGASGWYVLGREVEQFEAALAAYWGVRHAIGVANGLDALEIALRARGLRPGERVLTTPLSAFATTLAIVRASGQPVFVDVDDDGALDLEVCDAVLSAERAAGRAIRFLLPVHLYGRSMDLDRLAALRDDHDLVIVEDCAQSIGAGRGDRNAGTVGAAAACSFYPTKNLGALGDGGALLTDDDELAETARSLRHYGQRGRFEHVRLGMNSRLDEVQAAVLHDALLPRLDDWIARRGAIAARYRGLENVTRPTEAAPPESVWHLFPVTVPAAERSAFMAHLGEQGIQVGVHYPSLIPEQAALRSAPHAILGDASLPRARRLTECSVSLPVHPFLTDAEVERVLAACGTWSAS